MPDRSRIPVIISKFDAYINATDNYLAAGTPTNRERLGLTATDATNWHNKRLFWRDTLFPQYINPLTSTSAVKDQVRIFMKDFRTFGSPLLNIMAASPNATQADEQMFNFKIRPAAPTRPVTVITEAVTCETKSLNGGLVEFTCRPAHDSKRPSKLPGSDSIQLAYLLHPREGASSPDPDSDLMAKDLFSKAVFIKNFGVANKGRLVICYLRWYNTKRPHLSGPWTGPFVVGIA